ncbi:hypothetical protein BJV77DRAFT_1136908 [Russula vinacea]|nr:hypothetical protein BJV77DRAFT_1136908 [Russula vinacea]
MHGGIGVWFCEMEVWRTVRTPEERLPLLQKYLPVRFQELLHGHGYSSLVLPRSPSVHNGEKPYEEGVYYMQFALKSKSKKLSLSCSTLTQDRTSGGRRRTLSRYVQTYHLHAVIRQRKTKQTVNVEDSPSSPGQQIRPWASTVQIAVGSRAAIALYALRAATVLYAGRQLLYSGGNFSIRAATDLHRRRHYCK